MKCYATKTEKYWRCRREHGARDCSKCNIQNDAVLRAQAKATAKEMKGVERRKEAKK